MVTVHLRINDASTGQPLPVRVRLSTGPTHFMPLGRFTEFPTMRGEFVGGQTLLGTERWFSIDGACEVPLPSEVPIRVQACHGPQFAMLDETITLKPGQMAIRLSLSRRLNWHADGWLSVEGRCHDMTPHAALAEAAAEDVDVVQLLLRERRVLSQDGNTFRVVPNLQAYSGQQSALSRDGREVLINSFNTHAVLGQLALLHTHRLIHPLSFGPPEESDDWSLTDWCHQCHRKKGYVVWCNPFSGGVLTGGEALVDAILGLVDAIEFDGRPRPVPFLPVWYRLLNCGLKLPLLAASAKDSNTTLLGWPRTFVNVQTESEAPRKSWIQALRDAPSFVTNGPLVKLNRQDNSNRVEVIAESVVAFSNLELVQNGRRVASVDSRATDGTYRASLTWDVNPTGWVAARIMAKEFSPFAPGLPLFAHTNPLWLGPSPVPRLEDLDFLHRLVVQTRDWLAEHGQFRREQSRTDHLARCELALNRVKQLGQPHAGGDSGSVNERAV